VGDDTLHAPLPFHSVPPFIASRAPNVTDDTPIDLIFANFIQDQLLTILNSLQTTKNYSLADVKQYSPILTNQALGVFAQVAWN